MSHWNSRAVPFTCVSRVAKVPASGCRSEPLEQQGRPVYLRRQGCTDALSACGEMKVGCRRDKGNATGLLKQQLAIQSGVTGMTNDLQSAAATPFEGNTHRSQVEHKCTINTACTCVCTYTYTSSAQMSSASQAMRVPARSCWNVHDSRACTRKALIPTALKSDMIDHAHFLQCSVVRRTHAPAALRPKDRAARCGCKPTRSPASASHARRKPEGQSRRVAQHQHHPWGSPKARANLHHLTYWDAQPSISINHGVIVQLRRHVRIDTCNAGAKTIRQGHITQHQHQPWGRYPPQV
eukprot:373626-Pelagomonas_calceolata.AAC.4